MSRTSLYVVYSRDVSRQTAELLCEHRWETTEDLDNKHACYILHPIMVRTCLIPVTKSIESCKRVMISFVDKVGPSWHASIQESIVTNKGIIKGVRFTKGMSYDN